jgi:hypothetical protein
MTGHLSIKEGYMPMKRKKLHIPFLRPLLCTCLLVFGLLIGGAQTIVAATPQLDIHYVPTPHGLVQRMLEMAEVNENDHVVDLGSGDGRIVIAAARDFNARSGLGIDLDPERIAEANANAKTAGVADRVVFEQGDLFLKDFSDASVVTLYLLHSLNMRLRPTILEMTPGTRVVSHAFDMGNWEPDLIDSVDGYKAFLWIVPARVEGTWELNRPGADRSTLYLTQTFQKIEGYAVSGNRRSVLNNVTLKGDEIRFTIGSDRYVGKIEGDNIVPVTDQDGVQGWNANRR